MGSVSSANSGLTDLLQTLTQNASPEMSNVLSMPSVQSALENAPSADIVQLSTQALQLQAIGELFGDSTASATGTASDPVLAALDAELTQSGSAASGSSASTAATPAADSSSSQDQAVSSQESDSSAQTSSTATSAQQSLQAAEIQALFGGDSASSASDSLLNMIG